jgi:ketose-bisphosphate aldolase
MIEPVATALRDCDSFGLIMVARLEWIKFKSGSLDAIHKEYQRFKTARHTRLHLDHVPVIDEDGLQVNYEDVLTQAMRIGYESVMVDGSRLSLAENIAATLRIVTLAHASDVPVEAELGAILGHETGPLPDYDEMFKSGRGFTSPDEARRFVKETGVDWLSVAIGNVHGAIASATRGQKKVDARLDIERLKAIRRAVGIPLVLHGGTGIRKEYIDTAIKNGIAKINVATAIRQPYESLMNESVSEAQDAVYETMKQIVKELNIEGSAKLLKPDEE